MSETSSVNDMRIHENSIAHVKFTAKWNNESRSHTAIRHVEKFNVWRDIDLLPEQLKKDVLHQPVGKGGDHKFTSGNVVSAWQSTNLFTLPLKNFYGVLPKLVEPKAGRFYPKDWIKGVKDVYFGNMFPVRVVEVTDNEITVDFNHSLSSYDINLNVEIMDIFPPSDDGIFQTVWLERGN